MWHVVSIQVTVSYSLCVRVKVRQVIPSEYFDENQPDWLFLLPALATYHLFPSMSYMTLGHRLRQGSVGVGWMAHPVHIYVCPCVYVCVSLASSLRVTLLYKTSALYVWTSSRRCILLWPFVLGCLFLQIKWQWHTPRGQKWPPAVRNEQQLSCSVIYSFTPGQVVNALSCTTYNHKATSIVLDTTCTCPSNS